jgi:polyhydroxyalkanoate synthesis regulator phasin
MSTNHDTTPVGPNNTNTNASAESAKDKKPLPEHFREAWSHALAAVSSAEDEALKALSRVSDKAGWSQEEVRKHVRTFAERLGQQRHELEKNMEQGVKRALSRMKLPRREEVEALRVRATELTARIDNLIQRRSTR